VLWHRKLVALAIAGRLSVPWHGCMRVLSISGTPALAYARVAHKLCATYDTIYLEDLDLRGMQALWGRKVTALGFGRFEQVVYQAAAKHGTHVHHIDRFFPSTKRCHVCGFINPAITLRDRLWTCQRCDTVHKRDYNAAINMCWEGVSSHVQGGCMTCPQVATA
jgi:transposase